MMPSLYVLTAGDVDAVEGGLDAELRASRAWSAISAGVQQGLGGDAAAVQAGAAELVLLHQADVKPSWAARRAAA